MSTIDDEPNPENTPDRKLRTLDELKQYGLVYIASPYSAYPRGHDLAYSDLAEVLWWFKIAGIRHFSPIVYSHPLTTLWGVNRLQSRFWSEFDKTMMEVCDALVIIDMDGWADSSGIAIEQAIFESDGKPVYHCDPIRLKLTRE